VLTVDFNQFPIQAGERVLDLGCGFGRHAFEAYRRGRRP
jgi:cyclopropane fatty-acyl-phospholipid synthase-like methyltransferase